MTVRAFESPPAGDEEIAAALAEGHPAMIVERPEIFGSRRAPRPLEVSGWAWSGFGIDTVLVVVDGEVEIKALHDLFRPDLRSLFGDELATSGFAIRVDPRDWAPGWHELTVIATDNHGHAIGVTEQFQSVDQPPPRNNPTDTIDPLPTRTYLVSLLCDDDALQRQGPATPPASSTPPQVASLVPAHDDETLQMWQQRTVRAEIDLAVRQTDAYWDLYVGNDKIARAIAREHELRSRLAALERERDAARAACRAVQRSASWRLTAPLRHAKRLTRRS